MPIYQRQGLQLLAGIICKGKRGHVDWEAGKSGRCDLLAARLALSTTDQNSQWLHNNKAEHHYMHHTAGAMQLLLQDDAC